MKSIADWWVMMMKVYIMVTNDKFELPVAIADTVCELSRITGVDKRAIHSALSHVRSGKHKTSIYQEVEIESG